MRYAYKKKRVSIVQFLSYMRVKKEELEVTFFEGNTYVYRETLNEF